MIGTRKLVIATSGSEQEVLITLMEPQGSGTAWQCPYEITWPEETTKHYARGIDAIQAIGLALKMIGAELYTSDYHTQRQLRWEKAGDGYGFPVPNNLRSLLVGRDKEFDG